MRVFKILLFTFFINVFVSSGQEAKIKESYWISLFQNQREQALSKFQDGNKNDISTVLINEILKQENGVFTNEKDFIKKIQTFPNFEYYLYALWNEQYFFDYYLTEGFNNKNTKNITSINLEAINNQTVKQSMRYLQSAVVQRSNNWDKFYAINTEIPAIKNWQYCGVFENLNGSGLSTEYEPEKKAFSEKGFNANSNGYVNWYTDELRSKEAYQFYSNHAEYGAGINYAQTFIENTKEQKIILKVGGSNQLKIWLNDVPVFEKTNKGITDLDAYSVELTLPKGMNRLLVKNADTDGIAYFIVRILDFNNNEIQDCQFYNNYKPYVKSTLEDLNVKQIQHSVEAFFKEKIKKDEGNFFLKHCLINTYLRNSKYKEAKEIILPLLKDYPKSSFLRNHLMTCYNKENDFTSVKELKDNIKKDDEKYYLSYIYKFENAKEFFKLPIKEFDEFMAEFSESTDLQILKHSANMMSLIRKEDKIGLKKELDYITTNYRDQLNIINIYLSLYSNYLGEEDTAIKILEEIKKDYFDYSSILKLARFYNKRNKKDKVLKLFKEQYGILKGDNIYNRDYIAYLHKYKNYKESLPIINQLLTNFPYSFRALELKGTALEQLGREKEALGYYQKALKHNGSNTILRKKIEDLEGTKDYFEKLETKNIYDFISENRNKEIKNNYGYFYLLDESLVQFYPEGGGRTQSRYVIKVTSDSGIENMKEVNLGLSGSYSITKFEIVKPDKKLVPASKSGSSLVFNNLEIGDVIYIDYESSYSNGGRFYKDHVDYFQFNSYHPIVENNLKILVPKEVPFDFKLVNGDITYKKDTEEDYIVHQWNNNNSMALPPNEDYMPSINDIATYLHVGTIQSWDEIANWYSDLVRPQIIVNSDVQNAFNKIFPNGFSQLSDNEKAKRIYYYIMENFSYSHVSFRQSGFTPQKPAKTIKSKLGDCKDFSTLYVTLAQMAELKSHLVLVLTSDYGERPMILPSQDFNHCIVKVTIEGKSQYLELTDNNMPYKAIPTSLEKATVLDIPNKWEKKVKSGIYKLENITHIPSVIESNVDYVLRESTHKMKVETILKGSINSGYASIFKEKEYDVIKTKITDTFKNRLHGDFSLDSIYDIQYKLQDSIIKYSSDLRINEKVDEIGSLKVFSIPFVSHAYESSIISEDKREYPIDYLLYENVDYYISNFKIKIDKSKKFVELPESVSLSFKKHSFKIDYKLYKENELHVKIQANTFKERITAEEYTDFKAYVKSVLDVKTKLIGYK